MRCRVSLRWTAQRPSNDLSEDVSATDYCYGVTAKQALFVYLATPVVSDLSRGSRFRESDGETSDDDPGIAEIGQCSDGTKYTFADSESYDDDPGLGGLGFVASDTTLLTRVDDETYDDDAGLDALGIVGGSTVITKVDGETYDDDPGLGGFGSSCLEP